MADLTKGFAFVQETAVPKRVMNDQLAAYRAQQQADRKAAAEKIAAGMKGNKALTDNEVYADRGEATKTAARAKALVDIALIDRGLRGSVQVAADGEGFRWFVKAVAIEADEVEAEAEAEAK